MEVSIETIRSPDFKQIYAIGAIGGHSPYDFRIAFYNDSPRPIKEGGKSITVMERKIDMEVILSPLAAKELARWLGEHIMDYEKKFGEIKRPGAGLARRVTWRNQENLPPFRAICDEP